jgi:hypothetical protein
MTHVEFPYGKEKLSYAFGNELVGISPRCFSTHEGMHSDLALALLGDRRAPDFIFYRIGSWKKKALTQ